MKIDFKDGIGKLKKKLQTTQNTLTPMAKLTKQSLPITQPIKEHVTLVLSNTTL